MAPRLREQLQRLEAPVLGIVVNGIKVRRGGRSVSRLVPSSSRWLSDVGLSETRAACAPASWVPLNETAAPIHFEGDTKSV